MAAHLAVMEESAARLKPLREARRHLARKSLHAVAGPSWLLEWHPGEAKSGVMS